MTERDNVAYSDEAAARQGTAEGQTTAPPITFEYGVTGLRRSGGRLQEEFLPQLRGDAGRRVYQEMETDPLIGGVLLALQEVIGRLDWQIIAPENPTPEEQLQGGFAQECLEDMKDSWDVTLGQILSMNTYGWSLLEIVYKTRGGASADPTTNSRFSDGKTGWRKFAIRAQDTLLEWKFEDDGGLRGMLQQDQFSPNSSGIRAIPIQRALLFRTNEAKGNPEGRSMLRSAYRSWFYKKRLEELEAIGIERDLAGMPRAYAPEEWFEKAGDPRLATLTTAIRGAKRNELDGILLPSVFDQNNNRLVDFDLIGSGGSRAYNTDQVIQRYNNAIATSMLMDFLTLGHEGVGSYALGTAKISMWQLVVESIAKGIAAVVNTNAIPKLMRLNGWVPDRMPTLVFGEVAQADIAVLGAAIKQMVESGVIVPDRQLETYIRELLGLPMLEDDDVLPQQALDQQDDQLPVQETPVATEVVPQLSTDNAPPPAA